MTLILASIVIMLLAALGLCAGVLLGGRPLAGSCGGLSCGGDCATCGRGGSDESTTTTTTLRVEPRA